MATITLRDLLPRVAIFRPDIEEGKVQWCLEEATRRIARYSGCVYEYLPFQALLAGTTSLQVAPLTGKVMRVSEMIVSPNIGNAGANTYKDVWDADTNTPDLSALTPVSGDFYIVSVAGTTALNGISKWSVGDLAYYTTEWNQTKVTDYTYTQAANKPYQDAVLLAPQGGNGGTPNSWAEENGTIYFYGVPDFDYSIQIKACVVPTGEIDTVSMPIEAEDVIADGALSVLWAIPGPKGMQNLQAAQMSDIKFKKGLANLRSVAMFGYSGSPKFVTGNFAGRQSFNLANWYK